MQQQIQSTLDVIYENWRGYQEKLRSAVAPLTGEQPTLQPAPHMWPLGQLVQHIISVHVVGAARFTGTQRGGTGAWARRYVGVYRGTAAALDA